MTNATMAVPDTLRPVVLWDDSAIYSVHDDESYLSVGIVLEGGRSALPPAHLLALEIFERELGNGNPEARALVLSVLRGPMRPIKRDGFLQAVLDFARRVETRIDWSNSAEVTHG